MLDYRTARFWVDVRMHDSSGGLSLSLSLSLPLSTACVIVDRVVIRLVHKPAVKHLIKLELEEEDCWQLRGLRTKKEGLVDSGEDRILRLAREGGREGYILGDVAFAAGIFVLYGLCSSVKVK